MSHSNLRERREAVLIELYLMTCSQVAPVFIQNLLLLSERELAQVDNEKFWFITLIDLNSEIKFNASRSNETDEYPPLEDRPASSSTLTSQNRTIDRSKENPSVQRCMLETAHVECEHELCPYLEEDIILFLEYNRKHSLPWVR